MKKPLVSVVIPVYNVEKYIRRSIESVISQTYTNIEIIIVDDCGTDKSMAIVYDLMRATKDSRFKIAVNPQNKGLSGARNTGLKAASGEYVYFLDSDDYISFNCIETLTRPVRDNEFDVVIGNFAQHSDGVVGKGHLMPGNVTIIGRENIFKEYSEGKWYVMAWNKLCKRSFLIGNNLFFEEGLLHEDVLWSFKVFSTANSVALVNKATYNYIVRPQSIMTSMSVEKDLIIYLDVFERIKEFIQHSNQPLLPSQYKLVEGKKSGIVYSLLGIGRTDLLKKYYSRFRKQMLVSPLTAYRNKFIGFGGLIRDLHYILPVQFGASYRILFYNMAYKWRGKQIQGQVWK